jgi:hypothetical protein
MVNFVLTVYSTLTLLGLLPGDWSALPSVLVVAQGMAIQSVVQLSPTTTYKIHHYKIKL